MSIAREARRMLRAHRYGALGTLSKKFDGYPFGSITPYLTDHDGSLLIFISALAEHTKNIQHDTRVSLITHDQRDPHIQTQGRVTVIGNAQPDPNRELISLRYLRYFPEARICFEMNDFSFYRIRPIAIRYIGGFGKIHWVDMGKYATAHAAQFAQQEETLLAEINSKQQSMLRQLMLQHHGFDAGSVRAVGLDCDGMDVLYDEQVWRMDFAEEASSPTLDAFVTKG